MNDAAPSAAQPVSSSSSSIASPPASSHDAQRLPAQPTISQSRSFRDHRAKLLDHLIRSLDIAFYCEISVLYYEDCSTFRFLIRALMHWFSFTPKPEPAPSIPLPQRPFLTTIFGTNLLCALLHVFFTPPSGGEAVRYYLHGGLMIDFVGQSSPVSKWRLLAMDLLCLMLQAVLLSVTLEKHKGLGTAGIENTSVGQVQDHDAEEAGLRRSAELEPEVYEMQDMRRDVEGSIELHSEGEGRLEAFREGGQSNALDSFYSADYRLVDLHVLTDLRAQWRKRNLHPGIVNASGVQAAAMAARSRLTTTVRVDQAP